MCGIFMNYSLLEGGITSKGTKVLYNMALTSQVRGVDGTGLFFATTKGKKIKYYKEAVPASIFLDSGQWAKMVDGARFTVGHVRAATQGKLTDDNTHPFVYDNVVGVHNGTIHGWHSMEMFDEIEAELDSSAIFAALNACDPDEASVGKLLGQLESGAYALVWHDKRVNELRIARNADRPFHIAISDEDIWGASELGMLEWVLNRNSVAISSTFEVDTHTILSIPTDGRPARTHDYYNDIELVTTFGKASAYATSRWDNGWGSTWGDSWDDDLMTTGHTPYYENWKDAAADRLAAATVPSNVLVTSITVGQAWPYIDHVSEAVQSKVRHAITSLVGPIDVGRHYVSLYDHLSNELAERVEGSIVEPNGSCVRFPVHIVGSSDNGIPYGYVIVDGVTLPVSMPALSLPYTSPSAGILRVSELLDNGKEAIIMTAKLTSVRAYHHGEVCYRGIIPFDLREEEVLEGVDLDSDEGLMLMEDFYYGHPDMDMAGLKVDWEGGWAGYEIPTDTTETDQGVY
jgi:hypothetical protein